MARSVTIGDIKAMYGFNSMVVNASSLFSLSFAISGINFTQFTMAMNDKSTLILRNISIGEMVEYMKINASALDMLTMTNLRDRLAYSIKRSSVLSSQPVAYAAYKKNITIAQLSAMMINDFAVKVTGFTVPIMYKFYRLSFVDLANAKPLPFGALPNYVNMTMKVESQLNHYLTMSLDSIIRGMLIHKNPTEGTIDFIKDFGFIARNVTIGDIKAIYGINSVVVNGSSLFSLSFAISGINFTQFTMAMNDKSTMILRNITIGEMVDYMMISESALNMLTITNLRDRLAYSIKRSSVFSSQPVVYAAYKKGITTAQLSMMGIIDLAVKVTGFTVPIIQKLYRISDVDLANAKALRFGGLPTYVNMTMKIESQLQHYLTMSLDSITRAMIIHKNRTEGTIDFIKDFGFMARSVTIGDIKAMYGFNSMVVNASSLFSLSFAISGINFTQFTMAMNDKSTLILRNISIGEMVEYMKINASALDMLTMTNLRDRLAYSIKRSSVLSSQPVAYAAYKKNITIAQLSAMMINDFAVKVTGFTVPIMYKFYRLSFVDLANAKPLPFGALPNYVNMTMKVESQLNHYLTMSLDSIIRGMLIHKNPTEGTIDFIKDFGFIARNVTIGDIKAIYGINSVVVNGSSLFSLSFAISGINFTQFTMAMNDKSTMILRNITIGEMVDYMMISESALNMLTITNLRDRLAYSIKRSSVFSSQPVVYAAYKKGITTAQLSMMGIIDLAVKVTGFTVPIIQKLYRISDVDLANAKALRFGGLPTYVNMTMKIESQLQHYLTMSLDSITRAMIIHKNRTEGTIDFIKDFGFMARSVTIGDIKAMYGFNSMVVNASSLFSLSFAISGINFTQFTMAMNDKSTLILRNISIGEMVEYMKINASALDMLTMTNLRDRLAYSIKRSSVLSSQPVAYAAYKKNITIAQLSAMMINDFAVKVTGFTVPIMYKFYRLSFVDLANAKPLPFGALPNYVNMTMKVESQLNHYLTMSLDSIIRGMLIHKNPTEGTIDFIKDFGFIARNVTIGDIKAIYGINSVVVNGSSLFSLSFAISGINFTQFTMAMNDKSTMILRNITIGEMVDYMMISESALNMLTITNLRDRLAYSIKRSSVFSSQPVVYAAYKKGITIAQLSMMGIIDLAVKVTGFTVPIIQKLYRISDVDLANAKALRFGGLPTYVNMTMKIESQLQHYLTMSLDSITRAMIIHKNRTEGTIDFIKDFGFMARNVTIGDIKAMYGFNSMVVNASSLFSLSFAISGINFTQFTMAMNDKSTMILRNITIGEMVDYMMISESALNMLTITNLRDRLAYSIKRSSVFSSQPVVYAAYKKGITIAQLSMMGIIDLAVKVTGFTVPIIQKLYRISDVDLANAKALRFGGLPTYVNMTMKIESQLQHYLTMSLDSITRAMIIHKNRTEGTIDFIKDFGFMARSVTIGDIKAMYGFNSVVVNASSLFSLSFAISGINFTQFTMAMNDKSTLILRNISIGEMVEYMKINASALDMLTMTNLRDRLAYSIKRSSVLSSQPVAYAAYKKNITIAQLSAMMINDFAVKVTGFTVPIMYKFYRLSFVDLANAKPLPFGALPNYVNMTMKVESQLNHYLTMSLDSIIRGMLIHKNPTEGTIDFIKDFGFIARNVTIGDIKAIYGINSVVVNGSSLFSLSFAISGINFTQFTMAMNDKSTMILRNITIGEMVDYMMISESALNMLTITNLRDRLAYSIKRSSVFSSQPVVYAAYKKGITTAQLSMMGIIDLAVKVTGFTVPIIQKLYRISDVDLANAKALRFGGLPTYVNMTMKIESQLQHYLTMSLDSITRAMIIHKNRTEGTIDFIKDFGFMARSVTIGDIKAMYGFNSMVVNASSLFSLSFAISGINFTQFTMAMNDKSTLILRNISIGEMVEYMKINASALDMLTMTNLRDRLAYSIKRSSVFSSQPVAYAAYKKGITIAQLSGMRIIDLAVKVTGFTVPIMQKIYGISDVDFAVARSLVFGGLPNYVIGAMKVEFQLKHFYTMSFNSIYSAFVVHKNIALGRIDFKKDFNFLASHINMSLLNKIYGRSLDAIKQNTLPQFIDFLAGTNLSTVSNITSQQISILNSFTLEEGHHFLNSRLEPTVFESITLTKFMQSVISKASIVPGFFELLNKLVSGDPLQSSLLGLIRLANLAEPTVLQLLKSSFISANYYHRIKRLTLKEVFANKISSLPAQGVGQKTLMKVLQSIRSFKGWFYCVSCFSVKNTFL